MTSNATTPTRAVLFDFGGTLYDYRDLEAGWRECLRALKRMSFLDNGLCGVFFWILNFFVPHTVVDGRRI